MGYSLKMNDKIYPGLHHHTRQKVLRDMFIFNDEDRTVEDVVYAVCKYFKTEPAYVLVKSNKPDRVRPRQWMYLIAHKHCGLRVVSIAERFNKNHATILSGIKKLKGELEVYPEEKEVYKGIINILKESKNESS
jgi:chromosomal replication initiation ATPase DnaA